MTSTTPLGELRLVAEDGALVAADFVQLPDAGPHESRSVRRALLAPGPEDEHDEADPLLREAASQFAAYFDRRLTRFDLPLAPRGTAFQHRVWERLRAIPYGQVTTYGAIARELDMGGNAARAVGTANGRNPIAVVVPCHRVVGASGKLVGYAGGTARKQALLALEQDTLC